MTTFKKWTTWTSYSFLLIVVISLTLYYEKGILTMFKDIPRWLIYVLIVLHIPSIASGGLAFEIISTRFNIHLKWQDWLGLSFIANFLNQLLPYRPGLGFRYVYLKKRYDIRGSDFLNIMLVYFFLMLIVSSFFTIFGWLLSSLPPDFDFVTIFALAVLLVVSTMILWLKLKQNTLSHPIQKMIEGFHILTSSPFVVIVATSTFIFSTLLTGFMFYLTFFAMSSLIPFSDCLFLAGVASLAMVFPITPGNIGILESLMGTLTQILFNQFALGFSVIALFRVTQWIPSLIFGTTFSFILAGSVIPNLKNYHLKKD